MISSHAKPFLILICFLFSSFMAGAQVEDSLYHSGRDSESRDSSDHVTTGVIFTAADSIITEMPAQESVVRKKHDPTKAVLLSIIPGGGQIYNRKWWKLPIIYAGLGVSGYFIYINAVKTTNFRNEYFFRRYNAKEYYNPEFSTYTDEGVLSLRNYHRRNMEIAIGVCAIIYLLNFVDALVDAHLFDFDISDDLSLRISPAIIHNNSFINTLTPGLSLKLNLK